MSITSPDQAGLYKVLYVDDEPLSQKYFGQIVGEEFPVLTASSAEEGMALIEEQHASIGIVISDQRMHGVQGTSFLGSLSTKYPDIVRILATAYSDITTAIAAINEGAIYHYLRKPWEPQSLIQTVRQAMETFVLRAEREKLLMEKSSMMRQLLVTDRLAGYGVLAEGINHHLRNALVPVQSYLDLVAVENGHAMDDEMMNELNLAARTQVRHITDILARLSEVPKVKQTAPEDAFSVKDVWQDAINHLSESLQERNLRVQLTVSSDLPEIKGSHVRLSHVARLVLEDEVELLSTLGEIRVALSHRKAEGDTLEHVRMEISDSGPNVHETRLAAMFTPFFVRPENPKYLGMNLATCYITLHELGGWARAYNDETRGTVTVFCLPVTPPQRNSNASTLEALEGLLGPQS